MWVRENWRIIVGLPSQYFGISLLILSSRGCVLSLSASSAPCSCSTIQPPTQAGSLYSTKIGKHTESADEILNWPKNLFHTCVCVCKPPSSRSLLGDMQHMPTGLRFHGNHMPGGSMFLCMCECVITDGMKKSQN